MSDDNELREIEERIYQLSERWYRAQPDNPIVAFDCGMLCAVKTVLDTFLSDEDGQLTWIAERDARREEDRMRWALMKLRDEKVVDGGPR
jgi:hypothetical protein